MENCRTCKFFRDKNETVNEVNDDGIGYCRRYPRFLMSQKSGKSYYPDVMNDDDWCGEWIQKMEE